MKVPLGCYFMLHWSTDPLLLDEKPIKYNDWQTANTLIRKEVVMLEIIIEC